MFRIKYVTLALAIALLFVNDHRCTAADITPGYSGMAQLSENSFLTVNDRKNQIEPGYRIGIIELTAKDGIVFTPVNVGDWKDEEGDPGDLEACCGIPGRSGEFLVAESGYYKGKFGRIFHFSLLKDSQGVWTVSVNKAFRIYNRKLDDKNCSYKGDEVEGIACFNSLGKTILVYGERGGLTSDGTKVGTIVWGALDFASYEFNQMGEAALVDKSLLCDRDCSDLLLTANGDSISVISVATQDKGDNGPFRSIVYRAGRFLVDANRKTVQFVLDCKPHILVDLSAIKVEAIAGPAKNAPDSKYSIGTDDELFGGIWRPLSGE